MQTDSRVSQRAEGDFIFLGVASIAVLSVYFGNGWFVADFLPNLGVSQAVETV